MLSLKMVRNAQKIVKSKGVFLNNKKRKLLFNELNEFIKPYRISYL